MTLIELLKANNNYDPEIPAPGKLAGTDKEILHHYVSEFYEEHFLPYRDKNITLLEVGASHGGSLRMWYDYFRNGKIISVDRQNTLMPDMKKYPDIQIYFEDGYSDAFISKVPPLDIVIDDGPHTSSSQIAFVTKYFDLVKPGGLLVIEDIPDIDLTNTFKRLTDGYRSIVVDTREKYGRYDNIIFAAWK